MKAHIKMLKKSIELFLLGVVVLFALFNLILILSAVYESALYRTPLMNNLNYIFNYFYF